MELGLDQQLARAETLIFEAMRQSVGLNAVLDEANMIRLKYAITNTIKANYPDPTTVSYEIDQGGPLLQPVMVVKIDPPHGLEKMDIEIDL